MLFGECMPGSRSFVKQDVLLHDSKINCNGSEDVAILFIPFRHFLVKTIALIHLAGALTSKNEF